MKTRTIQLRLIIVGLIAWGAFPQTVNAQSRTQTGAVKGGVAGAIIGGIAGHQNGETAEGVLLGAALGAFTGGAIGRSQEQQDIRAYQYRLYQQQQLQQRMAKAVSLNDAVTMTRSGMSDRLIINQIRTYGIQQTVGVKEVIALHQNGVSEAVIQELQNSRIASSPRQPTNRAYAPTYSPTYARPTVVVQPRPVIIESHPRYRPYGHGYGHYGHRHHAKPVNSVRFHYSR